MVLLQADFDVEVPSIGIRVLISLTFKHQLPVLWESWGEINFDSFSLVGDLLTVASLANVLWFDNLFQN